MWYRIFKCVNDSFVMRQTSKLKFFFFTLPSGRQIPSLVDPSTGESPIALRLASQKITRRIDH